MNRISRILRIFPFGKDSNKTRRVEDDFIVMKKLGEGASGQIFKVRDRSDNKIYALKLIDPDIEFLDSEIELSKNSIDDLLDGIDKKYDDMYDPIAENQIVTFNPVLSIDKEMSLMKHVSKYPKCYPGIVCYYGFQNYIFENKLVYGLKMEYVPGINLYEMLKNDGFQGIDESVLRDYTIQLLKSLRYLHERGISHRDIKLDNIILDSRVQNKVVIVDMGFACSVQKKLDERPCVGAPGTLQYMSPEILTLRVEKTPSLWMSSDIWALGITLYSLAQGYEPYNGLNTPEEIYNYIETRDFPDLDLEDEQLESIIMSMLNRIPRLRPSPRQMYQELVGEL